MKKVLWLLLMFSIAFSSISRDIVILDGGDNTPVVGASVISANGMIIGTTNNNGRIEVKPNDYPLSIRCMGYEAHSQLNQNADTIFMVPASYTLNEVIVTPTDRPITRVLTYAREYCTGSTPNDTLQFYCEYMLEYYFAEGKVKGYSKSHESSHPLAVKRYGRIANANGLDSIMRPKYDDDITSLSFMSNMAFVPCQKKELTDAMKAGALADTIQGKYFPKYIYRLNNGNFSIDCDALSDHKTHSFSPWFFKMLGMTMDMKQGNWTLMYKQNDSGIYGITDYVYNTGNMRLIGKGKLLKKMLGITDAIEINCYIEQYPVEIERLTVDEYKEQKKTYYEHRSDFKIPDNIQPLPPAIQNLLNRINSQIPTKKR